MTKILIRCSGDAGQRRWRGKAHNAALCVWRLSLLTVVNCRRSRATRAGLLVA